MFFSSELRWIAASLMVVIIIALNGYNERKFPSSYTVPFTFLEMQPDDITCGPTSALMVLRYYGKSPSLDEIKRKTRTVWYSRQGRDIGMTAPAYVQVALQSYGLKSILTNGDIRRLKHLVALGKPCIVLVRSGEWSWHYVVVVGYDRGFIYYANPSNGMVEGLAEVYFERAWNWRSDLLMRECSWWPLFWLRSLEIYPNSLVYID